MIRRFLILGLSLALAHNGFLAHAATPAPKAEARRLVKPNVLPLALDDAFQFRKKKLFLFDPSNTQNTRNPMISFERMHLAYGYVTQEERKSRYGNYFTFWWRNERPAKLTVRLEYRQENLGPLVQAQEVELFAPKGTHKTKFEVTGDDYHDDGRVIAWRAILIEDGKIVALTQSALWN